MRKYILMVDDESSNIWDLEEAIDIASHAAGYDSIIREYAAHPEEAIYKMQECINRSETYSAIISDNHMKGSEGQTIDGDDFLRFITGNALYCITRDVSDLDSNLGSHGSLKNIVSGFGIKDEQAYEFLVDTFKDIRDYQKFISYFFDGINDPALLMLCGQPLEVDTSGLEERISLTQKGNISVDDRLCEIEILHKLVHQGVFPYEAVQEAISSIDRLRNGLPYKESF